jgi:hydroxycarboxylate dehydrogenase B
MRKESEKMKIDHTKLRLLANRIVAAGGSSPSEAEIVADHLVEANLRGHDSHGVGMLVAYVRDLEAGTLRANQTPQIVSDAGAISVWDARAGYGQVIARKAIEWAIGAARQHGVAVNGLRNAHHIGRVGTYGEIAAQAGMVALHFVNVASGPPPVAPFRGREGRFLTNPVCIAIPGTANNDPILLDFATSRVAMGKVRVAHNARKPVPEGTLLDHTGQPTTDPAVMYGTPRGVVLPFGEHKGSGLALACELLAGAIVGSATVTSGTPPERGIINGMLSIVIDPARLTTRDSMMSEIDAMIAWVKSAKPADPDLPVLVAGEPERMARAERLAHGIPIDDETWSQLSAVAERYQISIDR